MKLSYNENEVGGCRLSPHKIGVEEERRLSFEQRRLLLLRGAAASGREIPCKR